MNIFKKYKMRGTSYTWISSITIALFVVFIVLINVIVGICEDKFPMSFDLTKEKAYNLSSDTINYLKKVDNKVDIYVFFDEDKLSNYGIYYYQIKTTIKNYEKYNKNISVKFIDLLKNPSYTSMFPDQNLTDGDILITSNNKCETLSINDLLNKQNVNSGEYQVISSSNAEQDITSAIVRLMDENAPKIAIINGHGEIASEAFENMLTKNGYDLVNVNLLSEKIPDDCVTAVMLGTNKDLDENSLKSLDTFLLNNYKYGKTLVYAPNEISSDMPDFDSFLSRWGISIGNDIVFDSDLKYLAGNQGYITLSDYVNDEYKAKISDGFKVLVPKSRDLSMIFEQQGNYQVDTLLAFSKSAYKVPASATSDWQPSSQDIKSYPAAIRSSIISFDKMDKMQSNLIVFGSRGVFEQNMINSNAVSNSEYLLSMFSVICDKEQVINILPKDLSSNQLGMNQQQIFATSIVFLVVIPLILVITGLVVWAIRRKI